MTLKQLAEKILAEADKNPDLHVGWVRGFEDWGGSQGTVNKSLQFTLYTAQDLINRSSDWRDMKLVTIPLEKEIKKVR